jgi:hypothetical protein
MAKADGGLIGRLMGARDEASGPVWIAELSSEVKADFGRLIKELRLLETAQDEGRRNAPPTSDTNVNGTQLRIVGRIAQGLRALNAFLAEHLGEAVGAAQMRLPETLDVDHARAEIDGRIASALAERQTDLVALREHELETQRDLNYFRRRHDLHRAASYRESPLLVFAILVGMFVVESFANAFLLRRISEQGWVGGVALAAVISLINLGLGIIAGGVGWRLIGHRFPLQRVIGWVVAAGALALAFFWNIFAAHFREVAELAVDSDQGPGLGAHALDAMAHIKAHGLFGLSTILSWGLFALGLLVHLIASREAWDDMADRYWDYRRYHRAYRIARVDYEEAVAEAKAAADEEAREVLSDLEDRFIPQVMQRDRLSALAELGSRRLAEGRDAEAEWLRQGAALLKAYRDENVHVRSEPPPAYFARYPDADIYRRGLDPGAADQREADARALAQFQAQLQEMARTAADIQARNGAALSALRSHVVETIAGLTTRIDSLRAAVDREAGANLSRYAPDRSAPPPTEPGLDNAGSGPDASERAEPNFGA